ncbi:hypothetical protein HZ326_1328 [Fusarium oxysporum f. sp. albedinis]|nr:hypothetical protein HZ326_1328 [Fusarium oxysporum f. sp. albedinis]
MVIVSKRTLVQLLILKREFFTRRYIKHKPLQDEVFIESTPIRPRNISSEGGHSGQSVWSFPCSVVAYLINLEISKCYNTTRPQGKSVSEASKLVHVW